VSIQTVAENTDMALNEMQSRINAVSKELATTKDNVRQAKQSLIHLVDHWDERSQSALRNEIISIVEEVL